MEKNQSTFISVKNPQYLRRPIKLPDVFLKTFSKSTSPDNLSKNTILNRSLESAKKEGNRTQNNESFNNSRNCSSRSPISTKSRSPLLNQSKRKLSPLNKLLDTNLDLDKQDGENTIVYFNQANQVLQYEQLRREIYPIKTIPYLPKQVIVRSGKIPKQKLLLNNSNNASLSTNNLNNNFQQMSMDVLQEKSSIQEDTSQEDNQQTFITNQEIMKISEKSSLETSINLNAQDPQSQQNKKSYHAAINFSKKSNQELLRSGSSIILKNSDKSVIETTNKLEVTQMQKINKEENNTDSTINSNHLIYISKKKLQKQNKKMNSNFYTTNQNDNSSEKSDNNSDSKESISQNKKGIKFQNKDQSPSQRYLRAQYQKNKSSTQRKSSTSISSEQSIKTKLKEPKKGIQSIFKGVLKALRPILAFKLKKPATADQAIVTSINKRKSIYLSKFQKFSGSQINIAKNTRSLINSESNISEEEELDFFDNIKQDKAIINIDSQTNMRESKRSSHMYTFQSPLELKIQNMNQDKILFFNKIEQFNEEIANELVKDGLNVKQIEREASFVENDLTPQSWIQKIQSISAPYHARCLFYKNQRYQWEKVKVLGYSEEKMKYLIEKLDENKQKYVSRNVLAFRYEQMENIISRIETIKSKSKLAQDEKKFQLYLNKMDDSLVQGIPKEQKQKIFNLCLRQDYVSKVHNKLLSENILQETIQEVDSLYRCRMKKILVIQQMQQEENKNYFINEVGLEPRIIQEPIFPRRGCIYECAENFTQITKSILIYRNIFLQQECQKAVHQVQKINLQFASQSMFDVDLSTMKLPLKIGSLVKKQKESIDKMRIFLITNYRENVIHEIFDKLQKFYKFFETSKEDYLKSKLFCFLKRTEFQIITSLDSNVFMQSCQSWVQFLKSFTYPQIKILSEEFLNQSWSETNYNEDIHFQLNSLNVSDLWTCNNKQLLHLKVECNEQGKIMFFPNFEEICNQLCHPLHLLNDMVNSFQRLEKTVVPLIDFDFSDCYQVEQFSYIKQIEDFILQFVQKQWDTYVVPIVEKYSQYSHFFLQESVQLSQLFDPKNLQNKNLNIQIFARDSQLFSMSGPTKGKAQTTQQAVSSNAITQQNKSWITSSQQTQQQQQQQLQQQQQSSQNSNLLGSNLFASNNNSIRNSQRIIEKGLVDILLDITNATQSGNHYSLKQLKDTQSIREILMRLHQDIQKVKILQCDVIKTPLFLIKLSPCKKSTVFFGTNAKNILLKALVFVINQNIYALEECFEQLKLKISKFPNNEEELVQNKMIIDGCESEIDSFYAEIKHIGTYLDLVEEFYFQIDKDTQEQYWMLYTYPQQVRARLKQSKQIIESQEKKFKEAVEKEKQLLQLKIEKISQDFQSVKNFNNYQLAKDYSMEAQSLNEQINDALYQGQQINKREQLLQLSCIICKIKTINLLILFKKIETKYLLLEQIKLQSIYFIKLWELAFQLQIDRHKWMLGSLMKISFEQFKQKIQEYDQNKEEIKAKIQELVEDKSILKVISEIQKDIDQSRVSKPKNKIILQNCLFLLKQEISWMIEYLTTEAMIKRPQFYRDLFKECNLPVIEPNEDMSLKALIDIDLIHFRDQILECSERADNVFHTEKQLQQIQDKLKETLLDQGEFRETFIITNIAFLQKLIIEQQNSLQEIKDSDRIKHSLKQAQEIDQKVQSVKANINYIAQFQQLYVQAGELIDKIEYEKKTNSLMKPFHTAESFWRGVIRQIRENNSLFEADFKFDYNYQITNLQKFIEQFSQ